MKSIELNLEALEFSKQSSIDCPLQIIMNSKWLVWQLFLCSLKFWKQTFLDKLSIAHHSSCPLSPPALNRSTNSLSLFAMFVLTVNYASYDLTIRILPKSQDPSFFHVGFYLNNCGSKRSGSIGTFVVALFARLFGFLFMLPISIHHLVQMRHSLPHFEALYGCISSYTSHF